MPDHLHFFCAEGGEGAPCTLSQFVGLFKQWTSKRIARSSGSRPPVWQREFFDHVLRSSESYASKWAYVRDNPVRAGLAARWENWPYAGEIDTLEQPELQPRSPTAATPAVGLQPRSPTAATTVLVAEPPLSSPTCSGCARRVRRGGARRGGR